MSAVVATNAFDWKNPDYGPIYQQRIRRLAAIRANPAMLPSLRLYYRDHLIEFIEHWGVTIDPRNVGTAVPVVMPFVLFEEQRKWLAWSIQNWKDGEHSITEKSRDVGISWMAVALSCSMCLFYEDMAIGFGSQLQDKVDVIGDPSSLFAKARAFMSNLPPEFRGSWDVKKHAPFMKLLFPDTRSSMVGECGDSIGRGGRVAIQWIDEAAHLLHPKLVDASLSATTNCRFDMSSVYGTGNPFADKARSGKYRKWTFHWRSDPRKDAEWYAKLQETYDAVTIAQEYDINYSASAEGIVIPQVWVQAAVGAHLKLKIEPSGRKFAAFDVADGGADLCSFVGRHGFLLQHLHSWSGKTSDIFASTVKVFGYCDEYGYERFTYDADGLGAGCAGDSRVINEERMAAARPTIFDAPFRGSSEIEDPDDELIPKRKNKDVFANRKAQGWFQLRARFKQTYAAVVEGKPFEVDDIISIDPNIPELTTLLRELSQPTFKVNQVGKFVIDKSPDGTRSPNLADATMYAYAARLSTAELWEILGK
jgi:phage terminase large subunit